MSLSPLSWFLGPEYCTFAESVTAECHGQRGPPSPAVARGVGALDVHPRVAVQILRHSKIAVTMKIYTEVPSAATRDALKKLGQWLGS